MIVFALPTRDVAADHDDITFLRKTEVPVQLLSDPQLRQSANWTHTKAQKQSLGVLSPLSSAVRPRSISPACKPPLASLLITLDCHSKCQLHVTLWFASGREAQEHRVSANWCFQEHSCYASLLHSAAAPFCCSLGGPGDMESWIPCVWKAIFKAGCKGLYSIFKAALVGKFF